MFETMVGHLNSGGEWFCGWAWAMLWQSSIVIAILLVVDLLLRKHVRATVRYALWMLVLVKLALPPSLCMPTGVGYWCSVESAFQSKQTVEEKKPEVIRYDTSRIAVAPIESITVPSAPGATIATDVSSAQAAEAPQPAVAVTWQGMVFLAWVAGVLVLVLLLLQRLSFVRGLVAQSKPAGGRLREMMEACKAQAGVRGNVELRLTANMLSPAACGLLRPVVLMPRPLLESLSRERVRAVLMHELMHIRRRDLWVNMAQTALQIAHFYNPLLWLANARIRAIREQAVDEASLASLGDEAGEYGRTLVAVAEVAFSRPHFSLGLVGVVESKKSLASRIRHIARMGIPKSAKIGLAGVAAVIVMGCVLLPMANAKDRPAEFVIKGQVTDAATGKPIAGARVGDDGYAGGRQWTTSDADGNYSYLTWYEEHNISCSAPGYSTKKDILLTKLLGSEKEKTLDFALIEETAVDKKERAQSLVEGFFKHNYRDVTKRKTIEWGEPVTDANTGNVSIRYKYEATIWGKDKVINDEVFTFDRDGNFVSVNKVSLKETSYYRGRDPSESGISVYMVNKKVSSYAARLDLSKPEYTFAIACRISADGNEPGWPSISEPRLAARMAGTTTRRSVSPKTAQQYQDMEIVEVHTKGGQAGVIGRLPGLLPTYLVRGFKLVDGRWLNTGKGVANSYAGARAIADQGVDYRNSQDQSAMSGGNGQSSPKPGRVLNFELVASEAMKAIPSASEPNSSFIARLPNGVTIELVGIGKEEGEATSWWGPDGIPLSEPPFDHRGGSVSADKGEEVRVFAVMFKDLADGADGIIRTEPRGGSSEGGSMHSSVIKNGKPVMTFENGRVTSKMGHVRTVLKRGIASCIVRVGVSSGPWETSAEELRSTTGTWGTSTYGGPVGTVTFARPVADGERTFMIASHSIDTEKYDVRMVAVDIDDHEMRSSFSGSGGNDKFRQLTSTFDIPLDKVKGFRIQTRKYEWVEFKDLALEPSKNAPRFIIKGKVTDAATGKPIAGARVGDDGYAGGKQWTTSDANGNYSYLTWYEEHNISCSAPGYGAKKDILLTKVFGSEKEKVIDFALMPNWVTQPATPEAERALKWTWNLPGWGAVRLVAVFRPSEQPRKFWDPDGKPLPDFKADAYQFRDLRGNEQLAVVFERPIAMPGETPAPDGKFYSIQHWNEGEDVNEPVAWYGHGYAQWDDCGRLEPDKVLRYDGHDYVVNKFWQQGDDAHCTVHVQMDYTINRAQAVRVVAVDSRGGETPFGSYDEFIGYFTNGQKMMYYQAITSLPKAKIAYLKLQTQRIAWAKFRGFATKPSEPGVDALPAEVAAVKKALGTWFKGCSTGDAQVVKIAWLRGDASKAQRDVRTMKELLAANPRWEFSVLAVAWKGDDAMAVSKALPKGDPKQAGPMAMVWTLKKAGDQWKLTDIDLEALDGLQVENSRFMQQHPGASVWFDNPDTNAVPTQDEHKSR